MIRRYRPLIGGIGVAFAAASTGAQSTTVARVPSAGVDGTVFDSLITKGPLAGATVYVIGSPSTATTDRRGRFTLDSLSDGEHILTFSHRAFDTVGVRPPQVGVRVTAGSRARVVIATPSGASLVKTMCPGAPAEKTGLLLGVVRDVDSGVPLEGARVTSRWFELTIDRNGTHYETLEASAVANPSGVFRLWRAHGPSSVRAGGGA